MIILDYVNTGMVHYCKRPSLCIKARGRVVAVCGQVIASGHSISPAVVRIDCPKCVRILQGSDIGGLQTRPAAEYCPHCKGNLQDWTDPAGNTAIVCDFCELIVPFKFAPGAEEKAREAAVFALARSVPKCP